MIPQLVRVAGAPYAVLPPGVHQATLEEVREVFAYNERRLWLFGGLERVSMQLSAAGCRGLYLGGSFVTAKPHPNDFDGCWDPQGVVGAQLDPVLLAFDPGRKRQKRIYHGEMLVNGINADTGRPQLEYFQVEQHSGRAKGVLSIEVAALVATP